MGVPGYESVILRVEMSDEEGQLVRVDGLGEEKKKGLQRFACFGV